LCVFSCHFSTGVPINFIDGDRKEAFLQENKPTPELQIQIPAGMEFSPWRQDRMCCSSQGTVLQVRDVDRRKAALKPEAILQVHVIFTGGRLCWAQGVSHHMTFQPWEGPLPA
jgi:hypothetical protein